MPIRIPAVLDAILEATALETAAKARITGLRKVLDAEARRRYAEEGAAPTWKARGAGAVRFDAPGDWSATIADADAFGSYVAERHPDEVTAVIRLASADLADALQALSFVGITAEARTEVRPGFANKYLADLTVDVVEDRDEDGTVDRTIRVIDPATGELVDGVSATQANAAGKLVVTLDRDRRREVLEAAQREADALVAEATGQPAPAPIEPGRAVSLEEAIASGMVRPASSLVDSVEDQDAGYVAFEVTAPGAATPWDDEPHVYDPEDANGDTGYARSCKRCGRHRNEKGNGHIAAELSAEEAATVARFDAAPDALEHDAKVDKLLRVSANVLGAEPGLAALAAGHRTPYVGEGADGARRSAEIDRTEADTFDAGEDRDRCLASAARWDEQAAQLEATEAGSYTGSVGEASDKAILAAEAPGPDPAALLDGLSREVLRRYARAKGINPGGTKPDLIARLVEAGTTVSAVNAHAHATR